MFKAYDGAAGYRDARLREQVTRLQLSQDFFVSRMKSTHYTVTTSSIKQASNDLPTDAISEGYNGIHRSVHRILVDAHSATYSSFTVRSPHLSPCGSHQITASH